MKKISFPMIADILFYTACTWLFSLCILRYYRTALPVALACACLLALAAGLLSFLLLYGRNRKKLLLRKEREEQDRLLFHLALEKPERVRAALLSALLADGKEAHLQGDELNSDGNVVVPLFMMEPVSADETARLIRTHGGSFTLVCNALTAEAEKLISSFGIRTMRKDAVYDLFTRTGTTPDPLICGNLPRKSVRSKLRRSFSKANARPFLASGAVLLAMSLFTVFPVYYIIAGSVLLFTAIAVRLFGCAAP